MIGTEKCRNGDDWYEIQRKYTNEIHARLFRIFFLDKRHWFKIFGWVILLTFLFIILLFHYIVLFLNMYIQLWPLSSYPLTSVCLVQYVCMFVFASHFNNNMFMQIYYIIVQFAVEANALNEICTKYLRAFQ